MRTDFKPLTYEEFLEKINSRKPTSFNVEDAYFYNCHIGTEFNGKLVSHKLGYPDGYTIAFAEINEITQKLDDGTVINGHIEFVLGKKEYTLQEIDDLAQKEVTLTFRGFTKKGKPFFFHKFR